MKGRKNGRDGGKGGVWRNKAGDTVAIESINLASHISRRKKNDVTQRAKVSGKYQRISALLYGDLSSWGLEHPWRHLGNLRLLSFLED